MEPALLEVSYLSAFIVILLGFLVFLWMLWSKAKKSGFQSKRLDETSSVLTYEQMLKKGKLSREEYHKIQTALLQKHGFTEAPPKNIKTQERITKLPKEPNESKNENPLNK